MESTPMSKERLELLVDLEGIMSWCCNGYIQNYGPGGVYEGSGRKIPYPATFKKGDKTDKNMFSLTNGKLEQNVVMSGTYKFGANQMPVYHNLNKILEHLERYYDLKIS